MEIKGLKVFSVFLKDIHDVNKIRKFLCVAMCTERAIGLTKKHAETSGWIDFEVDQVTCLGDLDMLDLQYFGAPILQKDSKMGTLGECEVAKCQS